MNWFLSLRDMTLVVESDRTAPSMFTSGARGGSTISVMEAKISQEIFS